MDRPAVTSFAVSAAAVASAVLVLVAVLATLSVSLVALAEPVATAAALRDGLAYLWAEFTGWVGRLAS